MSKNATDKIATDKDRVPGVATRAVIYLRVSSPSQVNKGTDPEGYSIPAQRTACLRKAEAMGASVVDEYVDKAQSARSSDRPQLQAMLERLVAERDVDFVIVHKVDRLARNRVDDVEINLAIRQSGAALVSVSENIDETPSGMLLHGIMSSIAEFYSQNLSTEILKGLNQKASTGVYPGRAPIGYLNARQVSDGREIRSIELDPKRSSLIKWAFEAYATGDYGLRQLAESLADMGLLTRETPKFPAKRLRYTDVQRFLLNPFYIGAFIWRGVEYQGSHEPLISVETFAHVQAVLKTRRRAREKVRKHPHYLKGTLHCGRCGSRLSFTRSKGRSAYYDYFFCLGRHTKRNDCDLPHLPAAMVEQAVIAHYATVELGEAAAECIATATRQAIENYLKRAGGVADDQRKRITELERRRRKLLNAHLAGAVPVELLKESQAAINRQLANAGAALANTEIDRKTSERNLAIALGLAVRFQQAYQLAKAPVRRQLNQAVFEALHVDVDGISGATLTEPFGQLLGEDIADAAARYLTNPDPPEEGRGSKENKLVAIQALFQLSYSPICGVVPQRGGYLAPPAVARTGGVWPQAAKQAPVHDRPDRVASATLWVDGNPRRRNPRAPRAEASARRRQLRARSARAGGVRPGRPPRRSRVRDR